MGIVVFESDVRAEKPHVIAVAVRIRRREPIRVHLVVLYQAVILTPDPDTVRVSIDIVTLDGHV
jgi:hypothetical protein